VKLVGCSPFFFSVFFIHENPESYVQLSGFTSQYRRFFSNLNVATFADAVIPATVPESPYALKNGGSKPAIFKSFSEKEMPD
ncbi:hypothetical protein, partial [Fibrobacter sp. UWB12]|uniref:hypothetical protein n=1 Tax=Fibrobacter sp. UWB12 TaxID=1896203 RepID=UPI001C313F02